MTAVVNSAGAVVVELDDADVLDGAAVVLGGASLAVRASTAEDKASSSRPVMFFARAIVLL